MYENSLESAHHVSDAQGEKVAMAKGTGSLYRRFLRRKPQQARSESMIQATLEATIDLLSKGDDALVTVRKIAERAGIGTGTFYDYFHDRGSLLQSVIAKLTEDNHAAFREALDLHASSSLTEASTAIVDLAFKIYLKEPTLSRSVMRIAFRFGLMPMLAESQAQMSRIIAAKLQGRHDVTAVDCETSAYVLVQTMMGVVIARIWDENPACTNERLKAELVRTFVFTLSGKQV
jgi:AcrR family transcriptional regulator